MNRALGTNKPSISVVLALTEMTQSATKHKKSPSEAGADSSHKMQCFEKVPVSITRECLTNPRFGIPHFLCCRKEIKGAGFARNPHYPKETLNANLLAVAKSPCVRGLWAQTPPHLWRILLKAFEKSQTSPCIAGPQWRAAMY